MLIKVLIRAANLNSSEKMLNDFPQECAAADGNLCKDDEGRIGLVFHRYQRARRTRGGRSSDIQGDFGAYLLPNNRACILHRLKATVTDVAIELK